MDYKTRLWHFFFRCVNWDIAPLKIRKCYIQALYSSLNKKKIQGVFKDVSGHNFNFSSTQSNKKILQESDTRCLDLQDTWQLCSSLSRF